MHSKIISLKANEELIKRTKRKSSKGFWMISKQSWKKVEHKWEQEGIDFIDELVAMSKREQQVIALVKNNVRYDEEEAYYDYVVTINEGICEIAEMNYQSFLKGFRLLKTKGFMKRVKKDRYMLNPDFFIPSKEYQLFLHIWNETE